MIDPVSLAAGLARFLMPLLPRLVRAGADAAGDLADAAGKRLGEEARDRVAALWRRLWPRIEESPAARETVEDAAAHPDDARRETALSLALEKVLVADPELAGEIAELLRSARSATVAGRDVITVQGDENTVMSGEYNVSIGQARDVRLDRGPAAGAGQG